MDFLNNTPPWVWLVVGIALLALEALGAGGFLLGSAVAAVIVSLVLWVSPELGWAAQLLSFALGSLVFTLGYWKFFRKVNEQTDHPELNNRSALLVGQSIQLIEDMPSGVGRIQIGDTLWKVRTERPLSAGQTVKVIAYEGSTLIIQPSN